MQTLKALFGPLLLSLLPSLGTAGQLADKPQSLCRAEEQIFFTCAIRGSSKLVSLCGAPTLDHRRGYLQYRFGKPSAVELQFPRERANTQLAFRYAHYFRAQVDRTEVTFDNDKFRYVIFDYVEGDVKPVLRAAGVRVSRLYRLAQTNEIQCAGNPIGNLGLLEKALPRDPDNPLNS